MRQPATRRARGEDTRDRILSAARAEFARGGFAGTRLEAIARRAGLNKALIFYYFENKDGLARAVSAQRLASYALPRSADGVEDLFAWPAWLFDRGAQTLEAVRFALAEGIGADHARSALFDEERRRASFREQVARVREAQRGGSLPADLDAAQLTLFLYVLGVYPYILPQGACLITDAAPDTPVFRAGFHRFLRDLAQVVRVPLTRAPRAPAPLWAGTLETQPAGERVPSRERILAAALREFGLHGYRGARIEAIAQRAGVPRGSIAYYFGTKVKLFQALATERAWSTERVQQQLGISPDDPFGWSFSLFALGESSVEWVRMLIWEGLDWEPGGPSGSAVPFVLEHGRRAFWQRRSDAVRGYQAAGRLPAQMDTRQLTFFLWVLGLYPFLVPQIAYLICDRWPTETPFRADFEPFVHAVAGRIRAAAGLGADTLSAAAGVATIRRARR